MGYLNKSYRERVKQHFFLTSKWQGKLRFARIFRASISEQEHITKSEDIKSRSLAIIWRKLVFSSVFSKVLSVIILIAVGGGIWRNFLYESELSKGISALKRAYKEQRPLQARISGLDYAPFPVKRGNDDKLINDKQLALAERILLSEVLNNPTGAAHHALGRFYLTNVEFEKAIQQFQEGLKTDQRNAALWGDLGTAYLERSVADREKPNLNDVAVSLEHFHQAIEIDDSLLTAYFNKALCLQRINATMSARVVWEDYLKRDVTSAWSKEAERNLRSLQKHGIENKRPQEVLQDFLAAYRQRNKTQAWQILSQTKEMITSTMLPFQLARRLVTANLSNRMAEAEEALGAFRFAGEMERIHSGDPFFTELARFYSLNGKSKVALLNQAQDALQQGYQLCMQGYYDKATQSFEEAQAFYLRAGNGWESKVVDYWRAYCLTQRGEMKRSLLLLSVLLKACQGKKYHWLEAQAYSWSANNYALIGEYSRGAEQNKKALNISNTTGDLYIQQKTSSQLAEDYKLFNRLKEALELHRQSLPSGDQYYVSQWQFWRSLSSMADTLYALRLYAATEVIEREALQLAKYQFNNPGLTHKSYLRLGQIYAGRQDYPAAAQFLDLSLTSLKPIENEPMGKKLSGLSMLQMATVKRQAGDCPAALEYYRKVAEKFDASEFGLYNYNTHKGILLCHLFNKDDRAIQQELQTVLHLFEQNRQKIKEEMNRNHFFDAEQGVYDLTIEYEHTRSNKEQSFYYSELSRARSLQDVIIGGAIPSQDLSGPDSIVFAVSQPLTFTQLQQRLPVNFQLVEYAVLQNRLIIWVMTRTRFEVIEQPISKVALEAVTNEYLRVLPLGDADSIEREKQLATQLYDWIFAPATSYLNKAEVVTVVPDKFLFKIPFAALFSRRTTQRVVADYALLYAPSATVLAICSEVVRTKVQGKEAERFLGVGNPTFNRQQYPELRDLPSAAFEVEKVASLYNPKAVFVRDRALKEDIKPQLVQADIIHFATHYVTDSFLPAKSKLLLTFKRERKINEPAYDLSLHEIQTNRLPQAKVVILSSCQSGIEGYYAGEGLVGLSRAFIAAGSPLVIASQWAIESETTAELMIELHQFRKLQDVSTIRALRNAQLNMLKHKDERYRRPYYWAAFFPIGGQASY